MVLFVIYTKIKGNLNEIKRTIEDAKQLAELTLKKEKDLLLELSDYLSDNRMLKKEDIRRLVNNWSIENIDFIENGDTLFYRKHLKQCTQHKRCHHS